MKRRRWDSKTKTKIVLEGLSGRPVSEICNEYGIQDLTQIIGSLTVELKKTEDEFI